jgi:glycosyltransferase involved in cell wall biosynthesis
VLKIVANDSTSNSAFGCIATVVPSLDPKYGGPSVSVAALCRAMHAVEARARLYFAGRSWPDEPQWPDFFRRYEDAWPKALRRSPSLRRALLDDDVALVHHHALWLPTLGYAHRASRRHHAPLVISPRGMLASYALGQSRTRKRLATLFIHPNAFRDAAGWHATSSDEADEIRRAGFEQPIVVAPNGVDEPPWREPADRNAWFDRYPELRGRRILLFFSRFHSKKGVVPLLEWWGDLAPRFPDWHLLVSGTPDEFGLDEVLRHTKRLRIEDRTTSTLGMEMPKPYRLADLYVLPTLSENFGLTVGESLASGTPLLVSDQAPWHDINALGCGRCVPLSDWPAELAILLSRSSEELRTMGAVGRDYVRRAFSWDTQARTLLDFYDTLRI